LPLAARVTERESVSIYAGTGWNCWKAPANCGETYHVLFAPLKE
jgi:hypothetical protein